MTYPENIHSWTINWFESLPQSYQYLDRSQKNPTPPPWSGLNQLPFDFSEAGGWNVQYDGADGRDISQEFLSTPGEKVHYQIWVTPSSVPGGGEYDGAVYVYAFWQRGGDLLALNGADSLVNITEPRLLEGWFYPPKDGKFTFLISAVNATVGSPIGSAIADSKIVTLTTGIYDSVAEDPADSTAVRLNTVVGGPVGDDPSDATVVLLKTGSPVADTQPFMDAANISLRTVTYEELENIDKRENTYHPLLRFMDGIGQIGGQYRQVSDDLWDGIYTNPDTCPDSSLRWLAQMMGIHRNVYGGLANSVLRDLLKRTKTQGLAALGSRASLQEVFKSFLTGEQTCNVIPHPTEPHTIRVRVVLSEVPGGDLAALGKSLRASGTVPAGHIIQVVEGAPTWDQWESAAGETWNEYESHANTWSESNTLGLTFD